MLNQKFLFTPVGDPPTTSNIITNFIIIFAFLIIGYGILYLASRPGRRTFSSIFFGIFITLVLYSVSQTKYIKIIRIDPVSNRLSYDFVTITGHEGIVTINILTAKYSYKLQVTRGYSGYVLTLKDKDSELQIRESRSAEHHRDKNGLLRREMNRMDSIIMQIRNRTSPGSAFRSGGVFLLPRYRSHHSDLFQNLKIIA